MATRRTAAARAFTLIELMVVVTIISLLMAILLPAVKGAFDQAKQIKCGTNLENIGKILAQYAHENNFRFPSLPRAAGNAWNHVGYNGSAAHVLDDNGTDNYSVSRALYTCLIRGGTGATPDLFVCPATTNQAVADSDIKSYWDFPRARNISYSYQNYWAGGGASLSSDADFAVMADRNPQVQFQDEPYDGGTADQATIRTNVPPASYAKSGVKESANSPNHGGRGQNVLYTSGKVRWWFTPLAGVPAASNGVRDNIYTRQDGSDYGQPFGGDTWTQGPANSSDSVLAP